MMRIIVAPVGILVAPVRERKGLIYAGCLPLKP
jgi:hypothetical protein